jgi:hypothetical protein
MAASKWATEPRRRAWDSNPQPLTGHDISSVAASHSLTLRTQVFQPVYPVVCPAFRFPRWVTLPQKTDPIASLPSLCAPENPLPGIQPSRPVAAKHVRRPDQQRLAGDLVLAGQEARSYRPGLGTLTRSSLKTNWAAMSGSGWWSGLTASFRQTESPSAARRMNASG